MALNLVKPTIAELRLLIGASPADNRPRNSFSLYPAGFYTGSFIELTGPSKTEFVALFLKENPKIKTAWVEESITINPYALKQKLVDLNNILFVEGKRETAWCLNQVLSSGCFQTVVTQNCGFSEKDLRRFQLLSEKSHSHFFLLSDVTAASWIPHLQLKICKTVNTWDIQTLRKRGAL